MTSTEGIILRRIPYRSSGAVIDILTPTGKTGALLKGLDKKNSAVRQAETEPGTIADVILYPAKNPDSLSIVKELDVVPGTSPAGLTPLGAAQLMFICELTSRAVRGSQDDQMLYDFLRQCISSLRSGNEKFICMRYSYHLARILGFSPKYTPETDKERYFDMQDGIFSAIRPIHRYYLTPANARLFFSLAAAENDSLTFRSRDEYLKLWHILMTYFSLHVADFHIPQSLDFLKQLTLMELSL